MMIEKAELGESKYLDRTNQTDAIITSLLTIRNVKITYDVDSELEEFKGKTYSIIMEIQGIEFKVEVSKNLETGLITSTIKFYNLFGFPKNFNIINFPSNPYTQLIAKQVKSLIKIKLLKYNNWFQVKAAPYNLLDKFKESYKQWTNLQKFLEQACLEIEFPEICFTCL